MDLPWQSIETLAPPVMEIAEPVADHPVVPMKLLLLEPEVSEMAEAEPVDVKVLLTILLPTLFIMEKPLEDDVPVQRV